MKGYRTTPARQPESAIDAKCLILAALLSGTLLSTVAHAQTGVPGAATSADDPTASSANDIIVLGRFSDTGAQSAMKMDVPVLDTPFAVQAYSKDFIKSLDTTSVGELYNYMNGVKGNPTSNVITMRGFTSDGNRDRNNLMVDGLPGVTSRAASPPTIGIERVEVVKGPMSVLYGQIQPGGFINLITKKPQEQTSFLFDLKGTTFAASEVPFGRKNAFNVAVDATGPIESSHTLLYRIIGESRYQNSYRANYTFKSLYAAPSLQWNVGPVTKLILQTEYRDAYIPQDNANPLPNRDPALAGPITARYSEPGDIRHEIGKSAALTLTHNFGWARLNLVGRHLSLDSDQNDYAANGVVTRNGRFVVARRARTLFTKRRMDFIDASLTGDFTTGALSHHWLVGFDFGRDRLDEKRTRFFSGSCPGAQCFDIDVYNPVYGLVPDISTLPTGPASSLFDRRYTSKSVAGFVSDLISIGDHVKVMVGGRTFRDTTIGIANLAAPVEQTNRANKSLLPMGGLILQPSKDVSLYASYSESFTPIDPSRHAPDGTNSFVPTSGKQWEMGAKADHLLDNRLFLSIAAFKIKQDNIMQSFTCPAGSVETGVCWQQIGSAESKGIELDGNFQITEHWQVIAGYSYVDAIISASNDPVQVGAALANAPHHSANFWTRYDFSKSFGIGLGVVYTGARQGLVPTGPTPAAGQLIPLPAYAKVDLGFYYQTGPAAFALKFTNLFDKRYFDSIDAGSASVNANYGDPRSVTLSVSTRL